MRTVSLRAIFLIGFVIAMPVLALPTVARRLDDWLYGPPPAGVSQPPLAQQLSQVIEPQQADRASPASFDEIDTAETRRQPHEGLDALAPSPPPLAPLPPLVTTGQANQSAGNGDIGPLDGPTTARLVQIREELERLGAEYVLLETTDGHGSFRFHCQMRAGESGGGIREFEATAADPLSAAEKVLREASTWRTAARGNNLRRE